MNRRSNLRSYFGFKNKYFPLTPKLDFIKKCDNKISIIKDHYDYLFKKSKQQMILDKKMAEMNQKQSFEFEKIRLEKKIKLNQKRKILLKKQQLILSSYNNKMILDMILSNENFIKYINKKQRKNLKIETDTNTDIHKKMNISHSNMNKIYNITENTIDYGNNKLFKSINSFNIHNKAINSSENFSTQNSEINMNAKYYNSKKNKILTFPISNSIFTTSIPMSNNYYTPKNSVLYLRKKKNKKNDNKYLNDFSFRKNNPNNNYQIRKYSSSLINNKNKQIKPILKNKENIQKYLLTDEKIINEEDKNRELKGQYFSANKI